MLLLDILYHIMWLNAYGKGGWLCASWCMLADIKTTKDN